MDSSLSIEKRKDIVFHKTSGKTNKEIAEFLRISERTVTRIWKLFKERDNVLAQPRTQDLKISVPGLCKKLKKLGYRLKKTYVSRLNRIDQTLKKGENFGKANKQN
ncbi:MAG: helix-turn-helix domain-containing protein [Streptococcaceae bacterium]|nr:helix-turn-helix domain-containing protein [Streptococcaceae bacterium]